MCTIAFILISRTISLDMTYDMKFGLVTFLMTSMIIICILLIFRCYFSKCCLSRENLTPSTLSKRKFFIVIPLFMAIFIIFSFTNSLALNSINHTLDWPLVAAAIVTMINIISAIYQQPSLLIGLHSTPVAMMHFCEMICCPPFTFILDYMEYRRSQRIH
jgi:uncharacterized membrane-anchored protein